MSKTKGLFSQASPPSPQSLRNNLTSPPGKNTFYCKGRTQNKVKLLEFWTGWYRKFMETKTPT